MDCSKRHATSAQVAALIDFMQEHSDVAKGLIQSGLDKEDMESRWKDLTTTLNSMGGAIKSVDKWKQTWRDLKANNKKRAMKQQQSCDTSVGPSTDMLQENDSDNYAPPKKKIVAASFDEEIIKIERDKLELDRDYKVQKIEVLSRIATALEELAKRK